MFQKALRAWRQFRRPLPVAKCRQALDVAVSKTCWHAAFCWILGPLGVLLLDWLGYALGLREPAYAYDREMIVWCAAGVALAVASIRAALLFLKCDHLEKRLRRKHALRDDCSWACRIAASLVCGAFVSFPFGVVGMSFSKTVMIAEGFLDRPQSRTQVVAVVLQPKTLS